MTLLQIVLAVAAAAIANVGLVFLVADMLTSRAARTGDVTRAGSPLAA